MRIGKYISNSGYCSRREAEKLILEKKVKINNCLCLHPSQKVNENDIIKIKNKKIDLNREIKLWKIYKPIKFICTNKDPQKRKTIYELVPPNLPRLISIGRLDFMSEGILLLTNNGDYSRKLELPSSNFVRIYRVCIKGKINIEDIKKINKGIKINKINYHKIKIKKEKTNDSFTWILIKLKEGKNREIRNICNYFNWKIIKLIRIQYGPYKLLNLKPGSIREIKKII